MEYLRMYITETVDNAVKNITATIVTSIHIEIDEVNAENRKLLEQGAELKTMISSQKSVKGISNSSLNDTNLYKLASNTDKINTETNRNKNSSHNKKATGTVERAFHPLR